MDLGKDLVAASSTSLVLAILAEGESYGYAITQAGLAEDEAFLVAVKPMGSRDALSREFGGEHSERLWKQLVIGPDDAAAPKTVSRTETLVVFALAVAAAIAIKIPALFGLEIGDKNDEAFYARNVSFFVLPFLTAYFVWKRQMDPRRLSWLAEAKQSVLETMAPVLTRLFTPLFPILLLVFLATMAWTGRPIDIKREVLIAFDLLLAMVVGLVLYSASARDPEAPPNLFDRLQLLLIASALVVDAVALAAIASRISEFGFTPNRVAALGENLILLVNLTWSAWLYAGFLRGRAPFRALEAWPPSHLPRH